LNTSFQIGAALVLAIVTAVANAATGSGGGPPATLDRFHAAALYVPLIAVVVGALALLLRRREAAVIELGALPEEAVEEAA
jgi:hypothetical protein